MRFARSLLFACALVMPTVAVAENSSASAPLAAPAFSIAGIDEAALSLAVARYEALRAEGRAKKPRLVFIDYSKPSTEKRLWVIDMEKHQVLFHELVAHGRGSGDLLAQKFGNDAESHLTSLGTFVTAETYAGKHGYSLRLDGLDAGLNDRARARDIVFHGAEYVNEDFGKKYGRIGRSYGCPAVDTKIARDLIDAIADGSVVYARGPAAR